MSKSWRDLHWQLTERYLLVEGQIQLTYISLYELPLGIDGTLMGTFSLCQCWCSLSETFALLDSNYSLLIWYRLGATLLPK